ncbi:MAG: Xaa-Pro peptidase family protein [Clostridium sp.]|nr:Xaa-Pro peptidase family protein [Clostridium sp.]
MNQVYIEKLIGKMKEAGLDAVLISPSAEMNFFIGASPMQCERFQGLFVKADGEMFYVCNLLYGGEMKHALPESIPVYTWFDGEVMSEVVGKVLEEKGLKGKKIGVDSAAQAFNILDLMENAGVTFVNAKLLFEEVRIHKTHEELDGLRAAAHLVDEVFTEVLDYVRPGMTEQGVKDFLFNKMTERGGYDLWAIVACGPNGSYPHYTGSSRTIAEKDVLLMDFGCTLNNMCADMTRTVFIGDATDRERELYRIVKDSQETAEEMVKEGAFAPDIDAAARKVLGEYGYAETLINRVGHGIGYMIHEQPEIKASNPRKLEKGMAFSIEPGIYLAGDIGIRIEDIVVINEDGEREILNKSTKELIILK